MHKIGVGEMKLPNIHLRIFLILLFLPAISFAGQFMVTRVTDGDTITTVTNGRQIKVRLVGIDTPETSRKKNEPGQPFSQKAKIHLQKLILNKKSYFSSSLSQAFRKVL